jgi:PTH1 family peptidyl-tRNA hydrolase
LADALVARWRLPRWEKTGHVRSTGGQIPAGRVHVMKPQTWMNLSGKVLRDLRAPAPEHQFTDLLILVDDFALPAGSYRLRTTGSAGGHNGLKSVEEALGTRNYPRLRIGIGPKPAGVDQSDWVTDQMPAEDRKVVDELMPELCEVVERWVAGA